MAILGLVYVILCVPSIIYTIKATLPHKRLKKYDRELYATNIIEFLTVCTNPLIYTFLSPAYSNKTWNMIGRLTGENSWLLNGTV